MDVANEILDAIEIIVDKKIRENTAQIYLGICKSVSGNSCVMSINGKDNTIQFYGSIPTVGTIYRVFVPDGNMSMAFAITGNDDRKGLHYSNPNLLDNWYFGNPVNQRGLTEYTEVGYTIDRWQSGLKVTIASNLITLQALGTYSQISQTFELQLAGKIVTMSMLIRAHSNHNVGLLLYDYANQKEYSPNFVAVPIANQWVMVSTSFRVADDAPDKLTFIFYPDKTDAGDQTVDILAAKLELGSQQTLAHQDADGNWVLNEIPDYGEQLARCQRYFQLYSTADNRPSKAVDCRPTMRTDPSQGTIIIDGTTYYYNTADL